MFEPSIFRGYDIRGLYPSQMNEEVAYAIGQAFVQVMGAKKVVVGRDVRSSGVSLQQAMIEGVRDAGAEAIDIGVISTEMLYFASGNIECDGGMSVTASHNPAEWNGTKFIGKAGIPLTKSDTLGEIYEAVQSGKKITAEQKGTLSKIDLLPLYVQYLQKYLPQDLPPLKLVANPNFGANGKIVDQVCKDLPLEIVRLNWEEDGSFPKGTPDPLLPKNRGEIEKRIVAERADFGVAWDADADRCFFFDDKGRFFHGYYIAGLLIKHLLKTSPPGQTIVLERRLIWNNIRETEENGGKVVFGLAGHGFLKKKMREHNAIFCGEVSGHYLFRDFYFCDNGMIAFLTIIEMFAQEIKKGNTVSQLLDWYLEHYPISMEELNYITSDAKKVIEAAAEHFKEGSQNHEDGLSVEFPQWRFNLRMSANEPVLRGNIEARTPQELETRRRELMDFISSQGATLRDDS